MHKTDSGQSPPAPKSKWAKPMVRRLRAGSAEFNDGNVDDADGNNGAQDS